MGIMYVDIIYTFDKKKPKKKPNAIFLVSSPILLGMCLFFSGTAYYRIGMDSVYRNNHFRINWVGDKAISLLYPTHLFLILIRSYLQLRRDVLNNAALRSMPMTPISCSINSEGPTSVNMVNT